MISTLLANCSCFPLGDVVAEQAQEWHSQDEIVLNLPLARPHVQPDSHGLGGCIIAIYPSFWLQHGPGSSGDTHWKAPHFSKPLIIWPRTLNGQLTFGWSIIQKVWLVIEWLTIQQVSTLAMIDVILDRHSQNTVRYVLGGKFHSTFDCILNF